MTPKQIDKLACDDLREYLMGLVEALDALDEVDFFGPEGWRAMLNGDYDG